MRLVCQRCGRFDLQAMETIVSYWVALEINLILCSGQTEAAQSIRCQFVLKRETLV